MPRIHEKNNQNNRQTSNYTKKYDSLKNLFRHFLNNIIMDTTADKIENLIRIVEQLNERLTALEKKICPCCMCKICGGQDKNMKKCNYCSENICGNCANSFIRTDETVYYYCKQKC